MAKCAKPLDVMFHLGALYEAGALPDVGNYTMGRLVHLLALAQEISAPT